MMTQDQTPPAAAAAKGAKPSRKSVPKAGSADPGETVPVRPAKRADSKPVEPDPATVADLHPTPEKGSLPDMTASPQPAVTTAAEPDQTVPALAVPAAPLVQRDAMPPPGPRPVLPQRLVAKAENFKAGDHVVYPTHGVGKVDRIAAEEIAGQKLELIHITFDENRMTLRVPVNKARTAGLRKLSGRKQFDEVLAALKGRARIKRTMWSRRAQEYEAKINSGDPMSIAEVVRDLHRNAGQPDQSFSERQIFEAALERLAAEYGALEGLGKQEAIDKLLLFLKTE
ncbi:MAG: CarD family transcriptional regulator [Acidiphilium sp.]|nr:CarD family transcriptional regulator [Acidiphilium sp.]MDD4935045.1 CarD family transcriptional regulator [Acidiphilium sp.]